MSSNIIEIIVLFILFIVIIVGLLYWEHIGAHIGENRCFRNNEEDDEDED